MNYVAYVIIGLVAGFSSALLGIGGGVIMVPTLILFFSLPPRVATATSLAYICPVVAAGILIHWFKGHEIRWTVAMLAVPAGFVGAYLGTTIKEHISNAHLQIIFAVLMVLVGIRLGRRGWQELRAPAPADGPASLVSTGDAPGGAEQ